MYILYPLFKVDTSIQFRGVLMSRLKWNRTSVGTQSTCAEGSTISATTLTMKLYVTYYYLGVCIRSVWLVHISLTIEPTGDTCKLLLVGVTHSFGMVGHVQQSVRRMANCTMIEFQEVSKVRKPHRTRGYACFLKWSFFASLATGLSCSSISQRTSQGSDYILALCLHLHFCVSLQSLSSSLSSQFFFSILTSRQ